MSVMRNSAYQESQYKLPPVRCQHQSFAPHRTQWTGFPRRCGFFSECPQAEQENSQMTPLAIAVPQCPQKLWPRPPKDSTMPHPPAALEQKYSFAFMFHLLFFWLARFYF
jgi:hypothetical protein